MDAPVEDLLSIPKGEENDWLAPLPTDPAVAAPLDNVGGDDTEIVNGATLDEDFSEIARDKDRSKSQAGGESENVPSESDRAKKLRENGPAFPGIDMDKPTFEGHEPDAPLPTIPNKGFRPYEQIPTDKKSYLHVDVKQALSFFQRSLLDYLRIVFWLLKTTSTFDEFTAIFDGFKLWYQENFNYYDVEQWQTLESDSAVFKTAGNARDSVFDAHRANIKKFLEGVTQKLH